MRAKYRKAMRSEEYKNYARLRNGIETIPSVLRRNYNVDHLPRGWKRGKFTPGCKIMCLNFRKLFKFRIGRGNYAQNLVITASC